MMIELPATIPDVDVLLAMPAEELASRMLFGLQGRREAMFALTNLLGEVWGDVSTGRQGYPRNREGEIELAMEEAWSWLQVQGLIVSAGGMNRQGGWMRLSRRGRATRTEADFHDLTSASLLPKAILHPAIAQPVWLSFVRGEYDIAAYHAMKAVEIAVRAAGEYKDELIGTKLMQEAFKPDGGALTDMQAEAGERVGRMEFFKGAIASYKNPQSHRHVGLSDPAEAIEIIMLANHLLRIVDTRLSAIQGSRP